MNKNKKREPEIENPMQSWLTLNKYLKNYDSEDWKPLQKLLLKEARSANPRVVLLERLVGAVNRLQNRERYRYISELCGIKLK